MTLRNFLLTCLSLSVFNMPVGATIMYDADGSSTFTLIDSGGMTITASAGIEPPTTTTTGTGTAFIDLDTQIHDTPFPGLPLTAVSQSSALSGSAAAPGGFSTATVMNGYLIELDNTGSDTASTAKFTFSYS